MNGREGLIAAGLPLAGLIPGCSAPESCPAAFAGRGPVTYDPIFQTIESARGHIGARVESLHRGLLFVAGKRGDRLHGHRVVRLNDIDECAGAVVLHGRGGNQGDFAQRPQQQPRIYELVGKQREILVGKFDARNFTVPVVVSTCCPATSAFRLRSACDRRGRKHPPPACVRRFNCA